jgi:hypothetical protein
MSKLTASTQLKVYAALKSILYSNVDEFGQISFIWNSPKGEVNVKLTSYDMILKLSDGNSKIKTQSLQYGLKIGVFDMLAGLTCPAALQCKASVLVKNGDINQRFVLDEHHDYKCFAVKAESQYLWTFLNRLINSLVVSIASQDELIEDLNSLVCGYDMIRIHGSGDFFVKKYFMAWLSVAQLNPTMKFYGYTKMLPYVKYAKPDNFGLVYSDGGKFDDKVDETTPICAVLFEGQPLDFPLACESLENDFIHILAGESFSLHMH